MTSAMRVGKHQSRGNLTEARHRIAMVTGIPPAPCTNPYGDHLLSLSIQNKQDYARLHSYELHLMAEAVTSHIRAGPWQKVGFIQKVCPPDTCHLCTVTDPPVPCSHRTLPFAPL